MINAASAAGIATTWQQLEATHGGRATEYMRSILGPAIEIAAKNGQNSLSLQGVSLEFLQGLINALQSLGYGTNVIGDTFTVTW